ncbi:hypothetical protein ACLOJK_024526 [Asimina triloba]
MCRFTPRVRCGYCIQANSLHTIHKESPHGPHVSNGRKPSRAEPGSSLPPLLELRTYGKLTRVRDPTAERISLDGGIYGTRVLSKLRSHTIFFRAWEDLRGEKGKNSAAIYTHPSPRLSKSSVLERAESKSSETLHRFLAFGEERCRRERLKSSSSVPKASKTPIFSVIPDLRSHFLLQTHFYSHASQIRAGRLDDLQSFISTQTVRMKYYRGDPHAWIGVLLVNTRDARSLIRTVEMKHTCEIRASGANANLPGPGKQVGLPMRQPIQCFEAGKPYLCQVHVL